MQCVIIFLKCYLNRSLNEGALNTAAWSPTFTHDFTERLINEAQCVNILFIV